MEWFGNKSLLVLQCDLEENSLCIILTQKKYLTI